MNPDIRSELQAAINHGTYVTLITAEGGHGGFVLALGSDLVLVQTIYEWQDIGALVVPLHLIEAIEVSDHHDDQVKILEFNSVRRTKRYGWVRISNWADLFKALKFKDKFVVISFGDEEGADVGRIDAVEAEQVVLKAVDPGGNWHEDELECAYEDIILVQFDDSYSRVLQRFVDHTATPTSH